MVCQVGCQDNKINYLRIKINVISEEYAVTSGLGTGFGFTVKFAGDENHDIVDCWGLTFRKGK